jgi:hypothetical protein
MSSIEKTPLPLVDSLEERLLCEIQWLNSWNPTVARSLQTWFDGSGRSILNELRLLYRDADTRTQDTMRHALIAALEGATMAHSWNTSPEEEITLSLSWVQDILYVLQDSFTSSPGHGIVDDWPVGETSC